MAFWDVGFRKRKTLNLVNWGIDSRNESRNDSRNESRNDSRDSSYDDILRVWNSFLWSAWYSIALNDNLLKKLVGAKRILHVQVVTTFCNSVIAGGVGIGCFVDVVHEFFSSL